MRVSPSPLTLHGFRARAVLYAVLLIILAARGILLGSGLSLLTQSLCTIVFLLQIRLALSIAYRIAPGESGAGTDACTLSPVRTVDQRAGNSSCGRIRCDLRRNIVARIILLLISIREGGIAEKQCHDTDDDFFHNVLLGQIWHGWCQVDIQLSNNLTLYDTPKNRKSQGYNEDNGLFKAKIKNKNTLFFTKSRVFEHKMTRT